VNRRHRLRGRRRFAAVRAGGVEVRSGGVRVRALANSLDVSRAGFSIVQARQAVVRNRVRRRLRAVVAPLLAGTPGVDVVVTAPAGLAAVRETVGPLVVRALEEARR
jgi:ribonuclease P protein component